MRVDLVAGPTHSCLDSPSVVVRDTTGQATLIQSDSIRLEPHQFLYNKKDISLCYGLGVDMVHQDFPFQSIREKEFKREIKGMANS